MTSEQVLPDPTLDWPIAWEGVKMIAMREGLRLAAYLCPAGVWTIGWGETAGIREGMVWTKTQADAKLLEELTHYAAEVKGMCTVTPTANMLAGLVSCAYNIGLGALKGSTIIKCHNKGDFDSAARAFVLWNQFVNPKTGKREASNGLTLRRKQESALYLTPMPNEVGAESIDMPQQVAPESSLAKSPIGASGMLTGGAGALSLLSGLGDNADKVNTTVTQVTTATTGVKGLLAQFDVTPFEALGFVALVGGGIAAYYRWKQRSRGYA